MKTDVDPQVGGDPETPKRSPEYGDAERPWMSGRDGQVMAHSQGRVTLPPS